MPESGEKINSSKHNRNLMYFIVGLALCKFLIHFFTNLLGGYGIFRDELYYLACADHLSSGYVDHPPLSIYVLAIWRSFFGDSLFAIRLLPAIAGGTTVFVTGLIVRKLGGGKTAVIIAGLAVIASPLLLAMNTIFSMNCIDILLWTLAAWVLIIMIKDNKPRHWITLGLLIGLGLLNKISMGWFAAGLFAAIIVTKHRMALKTKWPYIAGLLALIIFSPYIIWNIMNDYAHLEFIRNASENKYAGVSPIDFIIGQPFMMLPVSMLIWVAGLWYFIINKKGRKFLILGVIYVTVVIILIVNGHSKPEYLSPTYPLLFAAGAVLIERIAKRRYLAWLKYAIPALTVLMGVVIAPVTLPCLPVETFVNYARTLDINVESYEEHELTELHQFYADMFGWENMAATVSRVYDSLPDSEKTDVVAVVNNYGKAGAIDYFRGKYDLPPVVSGHNSYFLWNKGDVTGDVIILLVSHPERITEFYESSEIADTVKCDYCIPYENNLQVYVCRGLKAPFEQILSRLRIYI